MDVEQSRKGKIGAEYVKAYLEPKKTLTVVLNCVCVCFIYCLAVLNIINQHL